MLQENYNVGIYCRLSRDDGQDSQSMSIENQKEMLINYTKQKNWSIHDVYIDDGFSGTSYDRPGFNRLITDIEQKKINLVITKDLSRLGRNYLLTGHYTEEYFPSHNVRYIAVNDNFDTNSENEFAPFKNIINEWYAKDISKKIRFSINQRMKKPIVCKNTQPLYGYLNTQDRKRVINPETAPIVKRIFNDYINGKSTKQIQQDLKEDKIFSPGYYYYLKLGINKKRYEEFNNTDEKYYWRPGTIQGILGNVEYLGALVTHKKEKVSFKSKKEKLIPKADRNYFYNVFEPIITKDIFDLVQKKLKSNHNIPLNDSENKLTSVLTCKCCGKTLKFRKRVYNNTNYTYIRKSYECRNDKCISRAAINLDVINQIINEEIKTISNAIINNKEKFISFAEEFVKSKLKSKKIEDSINTKTKLENQSKKIDAKIEALIEANLNDEIPYSSYQSILQKFKKEKEDLEKRISLLSNNIPKTIEVNYREYAINIINLLETYSSDNFINPIFLNTLTESISVTKKINEELKVKFTYHHSNLIKEFLKCQIH